MSTDAPDGGARLLKYAPEVLRRWEVRVRTEIPASKDQQHLVLRNNLQRLLAEVARALSPNSLPGELVEGLTLAQDHGGQRALLAEYSLADVFLEYRWLRKIILEVLDESGPLPVGERELITDALEKSMQDAGSQYSLIQHDAERQRGDEARRIAGELRTAYERERRIAQVLQRPLLLKVAEDAFSGLSLATFYEPAWAEADVGGDFYDAFALPDGRVALMVGDTCGKGLEAAAYSTQVKDVLRAFLREDPGHPGAGLSRLNRVVCDTLQSDDPNRFHSIFIVLSLLVLDPRTGEMVATSAGAEPPLVVRASGATHVVESAGMVLGVQPHDAYPETLLRLEPGDTVLLVTDGITEARCGGAMLGYEGMVRLAQQSLQAPSLQEAGEAILAGSRAAAGGCLADDACIILARRR